MLLHDAETAGRDQRMVDGPGAVGQLPDCAQGIPCSAGRRPGSLPCTGYGGCACRVIKASVVLVMQTCRQRLLFRLPNHPTIAGYFWIAYFAALALLFFA